MNADFLIPISLFLTIFGIVYLFLSTRNRERLALIEKGVDASIFMGDKSKSSSMFKLVLLNLALLSMGIGVGVFVVLILSTYTALDQNALYPAMIFLSSGIALFVGFNMTKKMEE